MNYVKLFVSLLDSTMWLKPPEIVKAWIGFLLKKDQDGIVRGAVPGLAQSFALPIEAVERAIADFTSPDPYSTTPDHEGRRLFAIPGGWQVVNADLYRDMGSVEDRRKKDNERQQRKRERDTSRPVTVGNAPSRTVTACHVSPVTKPEMSRQNRDKIENVTHAPVTNDRKSEVVRDVTVSDQDQIRIRSKQNTQDPPLSPPSVSALVDSLSSALAPKGKPESRERVCGVQESREEVGYEGEEAFQTDPLEEDTSSWQEDEQPEPVTGTPDPNTDEEVKPPVHKGAFHSGDRVTPSLLCDEYTANEPTIKAVFAAWLKACPKRANGGTQLTASRCTLIVDCLSHSTKEDMIQAIKGFSAEARKRAGDPKYHNLDDLHHILKSRDRIEDYIAKGKAPEKGTPSSGQKEWDWLVNEVIRRANYRDFPDKIRVVNRAIGGVSGIRDAQDDFALRRARDAWLAAWKETPDDARPELTPTQIEAQRAVKAAEEKGI